MLCLENLEEELRRKCFEERGRRGRGCTIRDDGWEILALQTVCRGILITLV